MLPRIVLHTAVSLDGRIDWFPADIGLFYQLAQTWAEDATLAGSDTILAALEAETGGEAGAEVGEGQGEPTEESRGKPAPLLVIPDSGGRIRTWEWLLQQPYWRAGVSLCSAATPPEHLAYLRSAKIGTVVAGEEKVDLRAALEILHDQHGVRLVRVDSGGSLNGVLLRAGLVNEVSVLLHPHLVGGLSPRSLFRAPDLQSAEGVLSLRLQSVERVGADILWLRYHVSSA